MVAKPVKVRLADIAAQAAVSEATVSRVLNERPGVSDSARLAVLNAIGVLGYQAPTRLAPRSGALVGLIVPELTNPIFPAFAQTIEHGLAMRGFTPVLCTQTPGGVHEDVYVEMLLARGVAGLICISGQHADIRTTVDRYVRLQQQGVPMVLVNGYRDGIEAAFISSDDEAAMDLSVSHLVELGHRRIGLAMGQEEYVPAQQKVAAFHRAMAAATPGQPVDEMIVHTFFTVEGGSLATQLLVERGATGIICGSDIMALGAMRQAQRMGLNVPRELSIVGYDDSMLMAFTDPPLTTIQQNVIDMSEAAVRSLIDGIGGHRPPGPELVFRPELVVRASTARVRASAIQSAGAGSR